MKPKFSFLLLSTFIIFNNLSLQSCTQRDETVKCFPETPINVVLNLNLPAYFNLQSMGGSIYVDEQQSGTRGLIVVKTTNGFKIYDRNAPHICPNNNTTLSVESKIKIVCPADGAEWILLTGQPTKVSTVPPKTYRYNYDSGSNILTIFD
jgi:hypothetical protein